MSLDQYLNSENIKESTKPVDALQLTREDQDIIQSEIVEIINFDDPELDEVLELHVYDANGQYVTSDHEADHWKHFSNDKSFIQYHLYKNLTDLGIDHGTYKIVLNFFRNLVGDENNPNLYIKNISSDRTELRCYIADNNISSKTKATETLNIPEATTELQLAELQTKRPELCNMDGLMDFLFINKGNNNIYQTVNFRWFSDRNELYIKLYKPLPESVQAKQRFWLSLQIRQPYTDNVVLYKTRIEAVTSTLKGPNFEIDTKFGAITETNFQTWNDLLGNNLATSQQIIDKMFSGSLAGVKLGIDYSGFQNFINFSSAKERFANFKYKVQLVEYYKDQITTLNSVSESREVNSNILLYNKYKDNVIGGFDGFEQYLYNEQTGSYYTHGISGSAIVHNTFTVEPWPKVQYNITSSADGFNPAGKYQLHSSTSPIVDSWYEGTIASASLWDIHNENALIKSVPEHIREDSNNSEFELFVNMIGHHYDIMWTYIKHQTAIWNRDEHYAHGLSKDLLYDTAKSLGWHLVNGNQSERLFEYLLGTNELGNIGNINDRKIDKDLILYVPFDEGRPDFAARNFIDYSNNSNNLESYSKPAFVDGAHGNGAQFYGDHYLKYSTPYDYGTDNYAVSFWVKDVMMSPAGGESTIFSALSGSTGIHGDGAGWRIKTNKDYGLQLIQFYSGSSGYHIVGLGSNALSTQNRAITSSYLDINTPEGTSTGGESNGWHHIAFNVDRSANMTSYFDGVQVSTSDISISSSHDIGPESIGDYPKPIIGAQDTNNTGLPYNHYSGSLDEFRVYKRLLTTDDIAELYNDRGLYISQSSAISTVTPKEELTHQVWRRIINNLPHLLKTKGTSRAVKALLSCYGIPASLLSIREFGGPKMPNSIPALIQDQFTYALQFSGSGPTTFGGTYIKWESDYYHTDIGSWGFVRSGSTSGHTIPHQTIEYRFRPASKQSMLLHSSLVSSATDWTTDTKMQIQVAIEHTGSYSGSSEYGRIHYTHGGAADTSTPMTSSTDWLPLYDGNFWNLRHWWSMTEGATDINEYYNEGPNTNVTYHVQVQQASDYVTGKIIHSGSATIEPIDSAHYGHWASSDATRRFILGGLNGEASQDTYNVNSYTAKAVIGTTSGNNTGLPTFTGAMQEYREWLEDIGQEKFDMHTLNPKSYVSSLSPSSSFDTLVRHYPLGTNQVGFDHSKILIISSSHPNQDIKDFSDSTGDGKNSYATASGWTSPTDTVNNDHYVRVDETYYIHGPSIGGKNLKSEKIRLEDNKLVHPLNRETRGEVSQYDTVSNDSNRLGIFFSPQDMINKDIFNQIGTAALDDYFGSAEYQYTDNYPRYKKFAYQYWKKYENDNDINAYIRIFALFDFSFFTQLKQLIPVRTNADIGLVIEPSVLERSKVVVESEPSIEHIPLEDVIPDPFPDPVMEPLPIDAVVEATEPMEADTLPIETSIHEIWELDGEDIKLDDTIEDPYEIEGDDPLHPIGTVSDTIQTLTGNTNLHTGSIKAQSEVITESELITIASIATGSSVFNDPDPGLDIFNINNGYPGAVYIHKSLYYSGSGWHTQTLHPSLTSPTGSIILNQRPSKMVSKKIFTYNPADKAKRIYQMDRLADGNIIDTAYQQRNALYFGTRAAGSNTIGDWTDTKRFESVTHNHFTGNMLEFDCFASMDTVARGHTYVQVPLWSAKPGGKGFEDTSGNPWSMSFLMKETPLAVGQYVYFMGNTLGALPFVGFRQDNSLILMDAGNNVHYCYKNFTDGALNPCIQRGKVAHYSITYEPYGTNSSSVRFYENGELLGGHDRNLGANTDGKKGSFYFDRIGAGYHSAAGHTYGFSGSMGCVRYFTYKLPYEEISHLNRHPEHRANRAHSDNLRASIETSRRRSRCNGWAPFTNLPGNAYGTWATDYTMEFSDYRDDPSDSVYYEGSKLTAPAINEPSINDLSGEPIVKITIRNRYNLVYQRNLPDGANIAIR